MVYLYTVSDVGPMPLLSVPVLLQLAAACQAQGVPDARMVATAQVESSRSTTALHDNTDRKSYSPATQDEAIALARSLLAQRHSIDAGVMQVTVANWARLGLTVETVFDPQLNVCAGKAVLAEAYAAERRISCRYNTGKPDCTNGYPDKIDAAMRVPSEVAAAPVPPAKPVRRAVVLVDALHPVAAGAAPSSDPPPRAYKEAFR